MDYLENLKLLNRDLKLLLPKEKWQLHIQIGMNSFNIVFSRDGIEIQDHIKSKTSLTCSEDDWLSMMLGVLKLRQCINLGTTKYNGNFRSLLLLESLFFLQAKVK